MFEKTDNICHTHKDYTRIFIDVYNNINLSYIFYFFIFTGTITSLRCCFVFYIDFLQRLNLFACWNPSYSLFTSLCVSELIPWAVGATKEKQRLITVVCQWHSDTHAVTKLSIMLCIRDRMFAEFLDVLRLWFGIFKLAVQSCKLNDLFGFQFGSKELWWPILKCSSSSNMWHEKTSRWRKQSFMDHLWPIDSETNGEKKFSYMGLNYGRCSNIVV